MSGGGVAGTLVTIAIFCVASYYVYTWNQELVNAGKTTTCGWGFGLRRSASLT